MAGKPGSVMTERNGLFIEYCAKDFLDGTQLLDPWEELAYRRIIDLVYATNDRLPDDDRKLAWMTKVGNRWKNIKAALIAAGKIYIEDGRITNARCQKTLAKSARKIEQASAAGHASAATGKSLKNLNRHGTGVPQSVATDAGTDIRTNHLTTEPKDSEETDVSSADPRRVIFVDIANWLAKERGSTIDRAKAWLGKMAKEHGDGNLIDACSKIRAGPYVNDVISALTAELKRTSRNGHAKPLTPAESLYAGAALALAERGNQRALDSRTHHDPAQPLLDSR